MDNTNFIKNLIIQKFETFKNFSEATNIPRSTLSTIFKNGIGGTSLDTIRKICITLNIPLDATSKEKVELFYVSKQEQGIIEKLRQLPPRELDKVVGMVEVKD